MSALLLTIPICWSYSVHASANRKLGLEAQVRRMAAICERFFYVRNMRLYFYGWLVLGRAYALPTWLGLPASLQAARPCLTWVAVLETVKTKEQ